MLRAGLSVLFGVFLIAAGCSTGDVQGTPLAGDDVDASTAAAVDAAVPRQCSPDTSPATPMDPSALPTCCTDGAAHCVPATKLPASVATSGQLAACSGGFCVPDPFIRIGKLSPPPKCKSINDADGVCLSVCIPQVASYKTILPQATCAADERCAPCISPLDHKATGACDIGMVCTGGDAGTTTSGDSGAADCPHKGPPVLDPSKLPSCAPEGGAHCLDKSLVPAAMQAKLAPCATGLCVPDTFIESGGNFIPPSCASVGGDEGRCLHVAIPQVAAQKAQLPQSTCATFEKCTPCYDPRDLSETGACKLSCDPGPAKPKPVCPHVGPPYLDVSPYPSCYTGGGAHCLDSTMVPASLASQLATCPPSGLCVPDVFSTNAGRYIAPTCDSIITAEGRCLHKAIPKVASQSNLPQSTCAAFESCVPCYSPIDGSDTGACRLTCDPGPARPKKVFADCCDLGGQTYGKCVPSASVPPSEAANLQQDTCATSDLLCAPTENLGSTFNPPTCTAFSLAYFGNYSGVCLSDCLHFSGLQSIVIKQGTCDAIHQCVPCKTPTGAATGAPGCPP